jgi:hypothetical protein
MNALLGILGKHVLSEDASRELARFPALHRGSEDVGPHEDGTPAVRYLRSEADGLLIKLSREGEILAIFMMSEGKDGFSQFRGELPGKLSFSSTPGDALKALGAPGYSKPAGKVGSFAHGELLRFDRPGYSVHFQFRGDRKGMELVTAMTAASVPGRAQAPSIG